MGVAGPFFEPHPSNLVRINFYLSCKNAEIFVMISQVVSDWEKISLSVMSTSWVVLDSCLHFKRTCAFICCAAGALTRVPCRAGYFLVWIESAEELFLKNCIHTLTLDHLFFSNEKDVDFHPTFDTFGKYLQFPGVDDFWSNSRSRRRQSRNCLQTWKPRWKLDSRRNWRNQAWTLEFLGHNAL